MIRDEKKREELLKDKKFLMHMLHGICNSLGIQSVPNEFYLYHNLYYSLAKQHFLLKKLNINLKEYVDEVNRGSPEQFFNRLVNLAQKLCVEKLNKEFPRVDAQGKILPLPFENLIWASVLIASAWLGWIFESKAIWHYDKQHPQERAILRNFVIPSIIDAFEQGVSKAIEDKKREGKLR